MFREAYAFNQPLDKLDLRELVSAKNMFESEYALKQPKTVSKFRIRYRRNVLIKKEIL